MTTPDARKESDAELLSLLPAEICDLSEALQRYPTAVRGRLLRLEREGLVTSTAFPLRRRVWHLAGVPPEDPTMRSVNRLTFPLRVTDIAAGLGVSPSAASNWAHKQCALGRLVRLADGRWERRQP